MLSLENASQQSAPLLIDQPVSRKKEQVNASAKIQWLACKLNCVYATKTIESTAIKLSKGITYDRDSQNFKERLRFSTTTYMFCFCMQQSRTISHK